MSNLLIINGVSYDIKSDKLRYAIDTQFNYFKFPPRIKSITVNDAINLDDVLEEVDIVSGRYIINEEEGIPAREGSTKIIYRAGEYDSSNVVDYFENPAANPAGYKMYNDYSVRTWTGAWLKPTMLDINFPLSGNELIKPGRFIITPDMIENGENIFFNIRVTLRLDLNPQWVKRMLSINPLEEITLTGTNPPHPRSATINVFVSGSQVIPNPLIANQLAIFGGNAAASTSQLAVQSSDYWKNNMDEYNPYATPIDPNIQLINVQNTALIELKVSRANDLPGIDLYDDEGAMTGTFDKTMGGFDPIGQDIELNIQSYVQSIKTLDNIYRSELSVYNNMLAQLSDRSTVTERNALSDAKTKVDTALNDLNTMINKLKNAQTILKQARLTHTKTNINSTGTYNTDIKYAVNKLHPVTENQLEMGYNIIYMVDISTAKAYDEYYITTACGSPYNLIYKDNTYWDVVPQSKLSTIF